MRTLPPALLALLLVSCSGADGPIASEETPAATLSLAELAARNVATTVVEVPPPPAPAPTIYRRLGEAVEAGELSPQDADRLLMPLFFGEAAALPEAFAADGAEPGVPDMALFWMLRRLPTYPEEVQAELRAWLPAERERRAAEMRSRWNLFAPRVALAAPQPTAGSCESGTLGGSFVNLAELDVTIGGAPARLAICGRSGDQVGLGTDVLGYALDAISGMNGFFGSSTSAVSTAPAPQVQLFLEGGALTTRAGDTASHGYMASCRDIAINATLPRCELESTVVHELFHCLHMRSQGYSISYVVEGQQEERLHRSTWWGRVPDWVSEGSAAWAEDRFDTADHTNAEWGFHEGMAELPHDSLDEREYTSAVFFNFVQQQAGGDDAMRSILDRFVTASIGGDVGGPEASELESLLQWPDAWFDFADA